jgi:hypothetical protein
VPDAGTAGLREQSYGPEATEMLRIPPGRQQDSVVPRSIDPVH